MQELKAHTGARVDKCGSLHAMQEQCNSLHSILVHSPILTGSDHAHSGDPKHASLIIARQKVHDIQQRSIEACKARSVTGTR